MVGALLVGEHYHAPQDNFPMPDESDAELPDEVAVKVPVEARPFIDSILNQVADAITNSKDGEFKVESTREHLPEGADVSRLIRLDKVIIGLWMMAAKFALRDQPSALGVLQKNLLAMLERFAGINGSKIVIKRLGWRAVPGLATIATIIGELNGVIEAHAIQNSLELSIRGQASRVRRDLLGIPMKRGHRVRKTKVVYTRNPGPKQRKANASWHSPKPR